MGLINAQKRRAYAAIDIPSSRADETTDRSG